MPETKLPTLLAASVFDGDGTITVRGGRDGLRDLLQSDAPFSDENVGEILRLDLKALPDRDLIIGDANNLALGVEAGATLRGSLHIIRNGDPKDVALLEQYSLRDVLTDETMYVALRIDAVAKAGADLRASWAPYGLGASFGAATGGEAQFVYLRPFQVAGHTARETLTQFFSRLRLPQNVRRIEDLPELGEVLSMTYGGYLRAGAELPWGYSMTRSSGFSLRDLDLKEKIHLEAQTRLRLAFGLAGNLTTEVRRARDGDPSWARVTVSKTRSRSFELAADLDVTVDLSAQDLPDAPTEFLDGVLGLRATSQLRQIETHVDRFAGADPAYVIDRLRKHADGLLRSFIDEFCDRVLGKPLDAIRSDTDVQKLHGWLTDVQQAQDQLGAKVIGFLEDELDGLDLGALIDELKAATGDLREASGLQEVSDSAVWRLVDVLTDRDRLGLITNTDAAFDELKARIETLEAVSLDRLATFIDARKAALDLERLLEQVASVDPSDLQKNVNRHLQDLIERLTGIGAEVLERSSVDEMRALQEKVHGLRAGFDSFADELYEQFQNALQGSYELALAYRYRSASEHEALLDVEIDLAAQQMQRGDAVLPSGADLMRDAVNGDFRSVLASAATDRVVIRTGILTHQVTKARDLSVHIFGWQHRRTEQLITRVEDVIEQKDGGVLHLYGVEAESRSRRRRRSEETEQALAFKVMAEGFQPTGEENERLVDAVTAMNSRYVLRIEDASTSRTELGEYLAFADHLTLIPNRYAGIGLDGGGDVRTARIDGYLNEIVSELGIDDDHFGTVTLEYHLRYDAAAMLEAFSSNVDLERLARTTLRTVASVAYAEFRPFQSLVDAYSESAIRRAWESDRLSTHRRGPLVYTLSSGGATRAIELSYHERLNLNRLYETEDAFVQELLKLDALVDAAAAGRKPSLNELEERLEAFVGFQKDLSMWMGFGGRAVVPPFLAVLNRLATAVTHKRSWTAALALRIEIGDGSATKLLVG